MLRLIALILTGSLLLFSPQAAAPLSDDLRKKPITTDNTDVGKLLRQWYDESTAAGNVGDWYDNRDGEHSPLDLSPWPQLRKVVYSADDIKRRRNWALQPRVLDHVVFGNSSTSGPPHLSGSNPRTYYCENPGLELLQKHYDKNNLYIYPEHRDHDPGHNGVNDGYGDLYPTNTPFLIISQGSSGSDQPFMRAMPFVLASFRPAVKKKLVDTGLLMPTIQMVFRSSNKHLKQTNEYLTGVAHPTVFDGASVDPMAMIRKAHDVRLNDIPSLVKLSVQEEETPTIGKDYFEPPGLSERLINSSTVIARFWRGSSGKRRMVVSAADSVDVNKKPLTFRWVVLRGDPERIKITPSDKTGTKAELVVDYHERRPIAPGSPLESNRVDIGVFAYNGVYYSAPAFITFYTFDSESRTYDVTGKVIEIAHGAGFTELRSLNSPRLLAELSKAGFAAKLLNLDAAQRQELARVTKIISALDEELASLRSKRTQAETARNKAEAARVETANKLASLLKEKKDDDALKVAVRVAAAAKDEALTTQKQWQSLHDRVLKTEAEHARKLNAPTDNFRRGALPTVLAQLDTLRRTPSLWADQPEFAKRLQDKANTAPYQRVLAARAKLIRLGIVADEQGTAIKLTPIRSGGKLSQRLTSFEKSALEEFHSIVLAELLFPELLQAVFHPNFVDGRLTAPKRFRDVYHYQGNTLTGWTRYAGGKLPKSHYTAEGWRIVKTDDDGQPLVARTVDYRQEPPPKGTIWANPNPLEPHDGNEQIVFRYEDGIRKIEKREKVD